METKTLMGIPSYFSSVLKNHPEIIIDLRTAMNGRRFEHLFFDANSIVYDAFHSLDLSQLVSLTDEEFYMALSHKVACSLELLIELIRPTMTLSICFDGIPPPAKIVQQRGRRFKTRHQANVVRQVAEALHEKGHAKPLEPLEHNNVVACRWSTSMITPGTPFMHVLSDYLTKWLPTLRARGLVACPTVLLSTSLEAGEGEHKIYGHLRTHPPREGDRVAIYGLDSDLIMLSLLSVHGIFVFREAPAFLSAKIGDIVAKNSRRTSGQKDEPYFINIDMMAESLGAILACGQPQPRISRFNPVAKNPLYDYVFMCFMLGNDFLPHLAALNLRADGLNTLLGHYAQSGGHRLINPDTLEIEWSGLLHLLTAIGNHEAELLVQEQSVFNRFPKDQAKTADEVVTNAPQYYPHTRSYIRPGVGNWRERYRHVFPHACPRRYLKQMADTWAYYTGRLSELECWVSEPPLVCDIVEALTKGIFLAKGWHEDILLEPLVKLSFGNCAEYLAYVLSTEPMRYQFTYDRFLWEVHVH